jgi:hypothetical protein
VHGEIDPLDDATIDVAALHGSREIEVTPQERGRVRHCAHHRTRLAAALDQLVEQLACPALGFLHGDRLDAAHDTTSIQ